MSKKLTETDWEKVEQYQVELDKIHGGYFIVKDYDDSTITFSNNQKTIVVNTQEILN